MKVHAYQKFRIMVLGLTQRFSFYPDSSVTLKWYTFSQGFHSEIFLSHCMCTLLPGFPILYQLVLLVGNHTLKCGSIAFLLFHVLMHSFFQQMFIGCLIRQALLHTMDSKLSLSCGANSGGKVSIHPKTHTMYNHRLEQ